MTFSESVKIAFGMQQKGVVPTSLVLDRASIDTKLLKLDFKGVSEITNDEVLLARMAHDLIIDKRVMYEREEAEGWQYVKQSLEDLRVRIDRFLDKFEGSSSEKDRFYASVLLDWRTCAKRALNLGIDAETREREDREAWRKFGLMERDDIIEVRDLLPEILSTFRYESYPCAAILVGMLPDGHSAKQQAERKLALTKAYLTERFARDGRPVPEPNWIVEY